MHACAHVISSPIKSSSPGVYGNPAWWSAGTGALYFHGLGDVLRKYPFTSGGTFNVGGMVAGTQKFGYPGALAWHLPWCPAWHLPWCTLPHAV